MVINSLNNISYDWEIFNEINQHSNIFILEEN